MSGISCSLSHPQLPQQAVKNSRYPSSSSLVFPSLAVHNSPCSSPNLIFKTLVLRGASGKLNVRCNSSKGSGSPGVVQSFKSMEILVRNVWGFRLESDWLFPNAETLIFCLADGLLSHVIDANEADLKNVVDAFFLGKALAEVISERVESTVGELLSAFGRLQAEQQKQVQEFQEEVLERAKREKEKAARESLEVEGLVAKPTLVTRETTDISPVVSPSSTSETTTEISPYSSNSTAATSGDPGENEKSIEID